MHLFFEAKNGEPTVRFDGTLLHSSYNPSREAERFAHRTSQGRCYLILGGGLGYLATALRTARPGTLICTIHPSRELAHAASATPGVHGSPETRSELSALLNAAFGREGPYGFEVLPWEPTKKAAPHWFEEQEAQVLALAREWHHSLISTGYFGFRWLRNSVRNITVHAGNSEPFVLAGGFQPVLVAPGPTLDRAIPWLLRERKGISLVAVSSAWAPLARHGITPDLLLHTDGGFWARHHVRLFYRKKGRPFPLLAASLRAELPGPLRNRPALMLTDPGSAVDRSLSAALTLPSLPLPGHGTVSGSALRLVTALFEGPPLLVGLDLAVYGLQTHARGHAFDPVFHGLTSRTATLPTLLRERLGDAKRLDPPWQQPPDLAVYASSLAAELAGLGAPCSRLFPSPVDLSCTEAPETFSPGLGLPAGSEEREQLRIEPPKGVGKSVAALIAQWKTVVEELPIRGFGPTEKQDEAAELLEELAQMIALPQLLRLRAAVDRQEGSEQAHRELKRSMIEKLQRLEEINR